MNKDEELKLYEKDLYYIPVYIAVALPISIATIVLQSSKFEIGIILFSSVFNICLQLYSLSHSHQKFGVHTGIYGLGSRPTLGWRGVTGLAAITSVISQAGIAVVIFILSIYKVGPWDMVSLIAQVMSWIVLPVVVDHFVRRALPFTQSDDG